MISTRNTIDMIDPELRKALDSLGRWALIGGAIRNALIGITPRDFDVMVWASPEQIFDVISQFDDARFRAYPCRERFAAKDFPLELRSADLGVQLRGTDVWSAMYPRWSGLPSDWNCLDFTINAGGMWNDGTFHSHPQFMNDVAERILRPLRSPIQAYRLEKFRKLGFSLVDGIHFADLGDGAVIAD